MHVKRLHRQNKKRHKSRQQKQGLMTPAQTYRCQEVVVEAYVTGPRVSNALWFWNLKASSYTRVPFSKSVLCHTHVHGAESCANFFSSTANTRNSFVPRPAVDESTNDSCPFPAVPCLLYAICACSDPGQAARNDSTHLPEGLPNLLSAVLAFSVREGVGKGHCVARSFQETP